MIAFIHIQRTGGTTLDRVLTRRFGDRGFVKLGWNGDVDLLRSSLAAAARDPELKAIAGHLPLGTAREFLPADTTYLSILREPVSRFVSQYNLARERPLPSTPFGLPVMPVDMSLEECVRSGEYFLENVMTRMLSNSLLPYGEVDDARLAEAKANLRDVVDVIGLTDRYDETFVLAHTLLGLPQSTYVHANKTEGPPAPAIPEETAELIRERNAFDVELYRYAEQCFEEQLAAARDDDFELDLEALRRAVSGDETPPPPGDLRARVVAARAALLVASFHHERDRAAQERKIAKLERRLALRSPRRLIRRIVPLP